MKVLTWDHTSENPLFKHLFMRLRTTMKPIQEILPRLSDGWHNWHSVPYPVVDTLKHSGCVDFEDIDGHVHGSSNVQGDVHGSVVHGGLSPPVSRDGEEYRGRMECSSWRGLPIGKFRLYGIACAYCAIEIWAPFYMHGSCLWMYRF